MKTKFLSLLLVGALSVPLLTVAQTNSSASSRLSTAQAKLMLHVAQSADAVGAVSSTARLGPLSFSSKEGFGLNAATTDISARVTYRVAPLTVGAGQTASVVQAAANAHFAAQKAGVVSAVSAALRAEGAASGWFAYEQPVTVAVQSASGATTQVRTLTWFVFVDMNGAGVAGNPKLINSTPLVLEMTVFPSNSEVNLTGYASGLPQGVVRYRLSDALTGNAITGYTDVSVGNVFDLANPDNTPDALMPCVVDSTSSGCSVANSDARKIMNDTGAAAAAIRYVAPPAIVYDLLSPTPNADGTYNYRERMSLAVTTRTLDYQTSCSNPVHRNAGQYNVTLQSSIYQYAVADNLNFNRISANPFTFTAFGGGGRPYDISQTVSSAQEATLQGQVINPLRPAEYLSQATTPNLNAVALTVLNKKEFCERDCSFPSTNYTVGAATCTTGAVSILHKGQGSFSNTRADYLGSITYSCQNGALTQQSATCEYIPPKANCAASTLNWSGADGGMCSASIASTLHNASRTLTDSTSASSTDGAGSANYICEDGAYRRVSSSCAVTYVPPAPTPEPEPAPPVPPQDPGPGQPLPPTDPDGTATPIPPASAETGMNVVGGDGMYFTSSYTQDSGGRYRYYLRSYKRQSTGVYTLVDTEDVGEVNGAASGGALSSPTQFSYYGSSMSYYDGMLAVGALAYNPTSVTVTNNYTRNGVGRIDFYTVNKATGVMVRVHTVVGEGTRAQYNLGRYLVTLKDAVVTTSDSDVNAGAVQYNIFAYNKSNITAAPTMLGPIEGSPAILARVGDARVAAISSAYNVSGQVRQVVSTYNVSTVGGTSYVGVNFTSGASLQYSTPNTTAGTVGTMVTDAGTINYRSPGPLSIQTSADSTKALVLATIVDSASSTNRHFGYQVLDVNPATGALSGVWSATGWKHFGPEGATVTLMSDNTLFGFGGKALGTSSFTNGQFFYNHPQGIYRRAVNQNSGVKSARVDSGSAYTQHMNVVPANFAAGPPLAIDGDTVASFTIQSGKLSSALSIRPQSSIMTSGF